METHEFTTFSEISGNGPRFLTIAELIKRTTLSRPTINRHIKKGVIPVVRLGRRVMINAEFLNQLERQSAPLVKEGEE